MGPRPGTDSMMAARRDSSSSLATQASIAFSHLPMSSRKAVIALHVHLGIGADFGLQLAQGVEMLEKLAPHAWRADRSASGASQVQGRSHRGSRGCRSEPAWQHPRGPSWRGCRWPRRSAASASGLTRTVSMPESKRHWWSWR